jgi:PKD repeat protein
VGWALVLADDEQLETLARLRFEPQATDDLGALVSAQGPEKAWLRAGLQPLLRKATTLQSLQAWVTTTDLSTTATVEAARAELRAAMRALTPEQTAGIAALSSVDDDADGLTNTQEQWWCTDPMNPDSDGDGVKDGDEVAALKDWMANRRSGPPASGKPFAGWPPQISGCRDDDQDSVPDLAERWELGLNMNRESTDRDKFDDGQELFGNTYCPGSGGYCGYGALPRNEDWGVIFAEMPSWVKAPGNHPLVAAFPVPEIDVVPSSLHVVAVTTVTTDHTISQGTERSYSTSRTEGTSTSVANTVTWNEWEEVSLTTPVMNIKTTSIRTQGLPPGLKLTGAGLTFLGSLGALALCTGPQAALCVGVGLLGLAGSTFELADAFAELHDQRQQQIGQNTKLPCNPAVQSCPGYIPYDYGARPQFPTDVRTQNVTRGATGVIYSQNPQAQSITIQPIVQAVFPEPRPMLTQTSGRSHGGAQTTTTKQYEEHTITNGEAFSSEESWGTATAVDSAHAADLWFTYKVRNTGTEYAREIANLAFNIYIGDDPNPAYTYFVGPDLGGDGKFHNFMPGEEHTYTSRRIPLNLDQMRAVDLGGPIRIVVEDFTYGIDELFYQDAVNAGVLIAIEDGTDDGDEAIDTYLIPTWGTETVLDVLARYFPHTADADGNLIAIWTPEYRSDTPAWCNEPRRVGTTLWCKHALSTADWWNVYTSGLGDGSEGFQDTPAAPGSVALFRFNKDSDLDGYSDRSEERLGTDPHDPASHPKPELIAGVHSIRSGNYVTATLSLLNTGLYDAYGVEAVMIAPDDSVSITNNTVGGSGRVRAQKQVIVGSRILLQSPLPPQWTQPGHAVPAVGGYYTGQADRTYTFTVQCSNPGGCDVGTGSWSLAWNDSTGITGTLNFGAGYASPTFQNVGSLGVKLALYTGKVYNGESFTVEARTPRDTFQYAINREPYTEPVVIVSYNDPQGNHRFVTPVRLSTPTENLASYSGQMLPDPGVEIVTTAPFTMGVNTVNLVVNNPTDRTLTNAHLFLEFVNISGTVVSEVPVTVTLPPGPTVQPVAFDVSRFTPPYQADQDYIVMAFWTDYQGNILDTAARPLSSFQADPRPAFAMRGADEVWDFGTAARGTLLRRTIALGSVGFMDLLTHIGSVPGLSISATGSRRLPPGDVALYDLTLNTADLPEGPFERTLTIRTSDPDHPTRTVTIRGIITPMPPDSPGGATLRPLDWAVTIPGSHSQGEWVEFTHTLGPDPQTLHPVKVYSQDYGTLWGVGKYATPFGQGTVLYDLFGDGRDGDLVIEAGQTVYVDNVRTYVSATSPAGQKNVFVGATSGFQIGDEVLVIQMQGTGVGRHEFGIVQELAEGKIMLKNNLQFTYTIDSNSKAQVLRVPHYRKVKIHNGGMLTVHKWDGTTGGTLVARIKEDLEIDPGGSLYVSGLGYRGGQRDSGADNYWEAWQGEGWPGQGTNSTGANGNGGGGGSSWNGGGGGGGGNGSPGERGRGESPGEGGKQVEAPDPNFLILGGGGGGGALIPGGSSWGPVCGTDGADGGGIIFVFARNLVVSGTVQAKGGDSASWEGSSACGGDWGATGGGGAGGSILLEVGTASLGDGFVTALGGRAGQGSYRGGDGGLGRIRIEYCYMLSGTTNPPASTQKLNCYIAEQVESAPYTTTRLNLPESFTDGRTYQVQYGRRLVFGSAGEQTTTLRVSAGAFTTASLDALISEVGSGSLTFRLDIGNDGSWDWEWTGNVDGATTLTHTGLAAAFNAYWATHGAPLTGTVDVPVRVYLSKGGQVLLTNLQMTPTGSKVRYLRLPARSYNTVTLQFIVNNGDPNPGPLTVAADVGDDGTVDWTFTGSPAYPATLTTGNLAAAVNAYLSGRSGEVDVPIRFYLAPFLALGLRDFAATPTDRPDAGLIAADIAFGASTPTEGDTVPVTATLHNTATLDSGPLTASFFAAAPGWGEWYIGSAFVPNIPAGGTAQARISWNTLGFTGTVPVRVVADPYNRLAETSESNNVATATLTIRTRPDLQVTGIVLSNDEPVAGETVTVTLTLRNNGQTTAGTQTVVLYQGNPDAGGTVVGAQGLAPLQGGNTTTVAFAWTPAAPGPYRLFARADRDNAVNEYDEGNNDAWRDVYVGLRGPILLDSGGASDVAYTPERGYGYVDEGQPDVTPACGSQGYETLRLDPGGQVIYRFDHLLPGHFYHLDVTLYECDGAGRQESIYVDGNRIAGPEDLSDGRVHRLSLRLDPALYADRGISATVQAPGIDGAVVGEVNLHDIDYRYADAGGQADPQYPGGRWAGLGRPYGWLEGVPNTAWGTLPYQSVRVNQGGNTLRYRFDGLNPARQYQVNLTFWQPSGTARIQKVQIDGTDTGLTVNTGDYQVHRVTVDVPASAYASDGSIVVGIVRTNAATGAFVNEIALEELTAVLPPVADFTASPTEGYAPLTVQFTDRSSGAITGRSWAFGDGGSDTIPNPVHTYNNPGVYTVTLTVSGPGGSNTLTRPDYITVTSIPVTATVVSMDPSTAQANPGVPITVAVAISNVTNLGSFQFTLAYSPTLVTVQNITLGEFPGSTGRSFTPVGPNIDNNAGTATFGAFSLGATPAGPSGSGVLAYVRLLPQAGGTAALVLSGVQVANVSGQSIQVVTRNGTLLITTCLGDFDGDGDVDILDVQRIAYRWNSHRGDALYEPAYDLDSDGDIDILDVQQVAYRWGTRCGQATGLEARPTQVQTPVALSVQPYSRTVTAGQVFTVGIVVSDVVDLGGFEFTLAYSPTVVQVVSATVGAFPGSTGRTFTPLGPNVDSVAGTVSFGAFSLGATPQGASGSGTLAVLTLRALAEGESGLLFCSAQVSDRSGNPQPVGDMAGGRVSVGQGYRVYLPLVLRNR